MDPQSDSMTDSKSSLKSPVVRGARACTVCRAAKMKCVGAEDGQKQCQRCKRANVECIFEKHRRGRKPGSKLSEASKMLRRLEKGLNSAKMKSQSADPALTSPYQAEGSRTPGAQDAHYSNHPAESGYMQGGSHFAGNELPPLDLSSYQNPDGYAASASNDSRSMDLDDDDEDPDRNEEPFFPAKLIKRENQRNSFFRTILNPEETPASTTASPNRGNSFTPPQSRLAPIPSGLHDPITAGHITEEDAQVLFDAIFLRLNPFINLFDPVLHTVPYVRSKCPFLFTTLIMAGCKFFRPNLFKVCQKLANEFAVRAFAEAWKRVEVVQAFACLTYWRDPDDNRTWTYIGYACRMAVELGLNRYVPRPSAHETEFQKLERRNRERTYLVLFVHDRSLSTQTGRHWMLPEDELIRHSHTWHQEGGGPVRPEDVIIAAFVQLRRIAAETTEIFNTSKYTSPGSNSDINYEVVLRNCNVKLMEWDEFWRTEMERANGEKFHLSFLSFFRLYVRLFLNSFGVQSSMTPGSRASPSAQALSTCCTSALDSLRIVSSDFANMSMLSYGQDSVTMMTAYSAVFLLKLLRTTNTLSQLQENTAQEIRLLISKTADAYQDASTLSSVSTNAAYHARFLRSLIANDSIFKARRNERDRHENGMSIDPRLQGIHENTRQVPNTPPYPQQVHVQQTHAQVYHFTPSPPHPAPREPEYSSEYSMHAAGATVGQTHYQGPYHNVPSVPHATESDAHYWKNMFIELGFGEENNANPLVAAVGTSDIRNNHRSAYIDGSHQQQYHAHQRQQGPVSYHQQTYQSSQQNYGH